jgi:hypothetical protein
VIYSLCQSVTGPAGAGPMIDVGCDSTTRARIIETFASIDASATFRMGYNRPTANGTRTSPIAFIPEDPADPAQTAVDSAVAWSVNPTAATDDFLRTEWTNSSGGMSFTMIFPRGIVIAASKIILVRTNGGATVGQWNWLVDV